MDFEGKGVGLNHGDMKQLLICGGIWGWTVFQFHRRLYLNRFFGFIKNLGILIFEL
jgi:hypothetical protein